MKIVVGADKGGFALKEAIVKYLSECGHTDIADVGTVDLNEPKTFTVIAEKTAELVSAGEYDRGILVCGTGMGMSIAANKVKGARAAVVESQYAASYARKINDANILCLGGFIIGAQLGCEIADTFINTDFVQDFPQWRIDFLHSQKELLGQMEDRRFK